MTRAAASLTCHLCSMYVAAQSPLFIPSGGVFTSCIGWKQQPKRGNYQGKLESVAAAQKNGQLYQSFCLFKGLLGFFFFSFRDHLKKEGEK